MYTRDNVHQPTQLPKKAKGCICAFSRQSLETGALIHPPSDSPPSGSFARNTKAKAPGCFRRKLKSFCSLGHGKTKS